MSYLDFELEIGVGSGREYPVAVVSSPAGEARETMRFPFSQLELQNYLLALENALLRSGGKRRRVLLPEQRAVRDFGQSLFDVLLSGEVRSRYDVSQREAASQDQGLRLKLRIQAPELAALPWEFLYDPREAEYVCLSRNTPVVRYLELPRPPRPLAVAPPLRILGMVASPKDQEPLDEELEKQRVREALQDLQAQGQVKLHWLAGQSWRDLQREMRKGPWHIFHFIGHGGFDQDRDEGFIALADEGGATWRLTATQLGRLLANHRSLRLALLNSCEGARGGKSDVFSSTASILVQRGIPAVLAMQYEITDGAAIELARTLYESLADGLPVDAALVEARAAISLAVNNTVEWGTPVLYTRAPNGVLFEVEEREAGEARPVPPAPTQVSDPAPAPRDKRLVELHQILVARFDEQEFRTLCFYLGVECNDLGGQGRASQARELLKYFDNRGQISALVESGKQLRPDIDWPLVTKARSADRAARTPKPGLAKSPAPFVTRQPFEPEMILIPAGEFLMGSDPKKDKQAQNDEQPRHTLYLPDYYLAQTPVTNAQYAAFVQATGWDRPEHWKDGRPPDGKEDHPVVHVSWHDAIAYCRWLSETTGRPYALPSEAQWEKGARGSDGRIYPWGDDWDTELCHSREGGKGDTMPIGVYPWGASPYGLLDMAGNVWEWTSSQYLVYPYQADDGRNDLADKTPPRVFRGGSFVDDRRYVRGAFRDGDDSHVHNDDLGFRVAVGSSKPKPKPANLAPFATRQPFEPQMILIPAGEFLMGSDPKKDKQVQSDEQPRHTLYLPDYYLAQTPVTNAQYATFVQATGHDRPEHWKGGRPPGGKENYPVVRVSWHDAIAYCRWLSETTGRPYALPSEVQWEKGARGSDGRVYPWGDNWDAKLCNSGEGGKGDATPVGTYPLGASPYDLLDMAGNVWEWVNDWYAAYPSTAQTDPTGPDTGSSSKVLRGGSWLDDQDYLRSAYRDYDTPDDSDSNVGFRCVSEPGW